MSDTLRSKLPHPLPYIREQANDMPTVEELTALDRNAGKVIAQMHGLLTETRAAIETCIESRYKGALWLEAEKSDRAAVTTGEKPAALATLIAGEPQRYALALALAGALEQRLDATRHSGKAAFAKAAQSARAKQTELLDDAATLTEQGWPKRDTARGLVALEDAARLVAEAQRLEALIRWLDGSDRRIDRNVAHFVPLDEVARGRLSAFEYDRRGSSPMTWPSSNGTRPADWQPGTRTSLSA
jgi:hypothetical protein